MNFENFIARRLVKKSDQKNVATPVIKIAIGAIALGLAIMIITVATGTGLQHEIRNKLSGLSGHIQVFSFDNNYNYTSNPIDINQSFYPEFKEVPEIKHIQVFANKPGIIRTEKDFEGIVMKGVSKDFDWDFISNSLIEGELPDYSVDRMSFEVLVSKYTASSLGLKLNDKFNIFFLEDENKTPKVRRFTISGIYSTGLSDFDENFAICDLRQIQRLNSWNSETVGGFEMFIEDFDDIKEVLPKVYHNIKFDLNAVSLIETNSYILEWLDLFDLNIVVILFIMLMVAGINMITALLILILEKTQMIGIFKAMGASNWTVRKIFLHHAFYLISRGLIIGNSIALILLFLQKNFSIVKLDPSIYYVSVAPVNLNLFHLIALNVLTLLIVLSLLIIPSYIITKISPSRSIKFD